MQRNRRDVGQVVLRRVISCFPPPWRGWTGVTRRGISYMLTRTPFPLCLLYFVGSEMWSFCEVFSRLNRTITHVAFNIIFFISARRHFRNDIFWISIRLFISEFRWKNIDENLETLTGWIFLDESCWKLLFEIFRIKYSFKVLKGEGKLNYDKFLNS